jgi:hypothetical protein
MDEDTVADQYEYEEEHKQSFISILLQEELHLSI